MSKESNQLARAYELYGFLKGFIVGFILGAGIAAAVLYLTINTI